MNKFKAEYEAMQVTYNKRMNNDAPKPLMNPDDLVYDARIGAVVSRDTAKLVTRITNDPTAFVVKPDYAHNEKVDDGDGYGQ